MGVHIVNAKLANGKAVEYHYAWRGGPRINAIPATHEYLVEYVRLTRDREDNKRLGMLPELIYQYRKSAHYNALKAQTKRSYEAAFDRIEAEFCDMEIEAISQKGARSLFLEWRDSFSETPRAADMLITVLARVFSFALDRELIDRNPLERPGKLSSGTRSDIIWSDQQVSAMREHAAPAMRLALEIALGTGQRQGDILAMKWNQYTGTHISLRQGKTGRFVKFKVLDSLKAALDAEKARREALDAAKGITRILGNETILVTDRGQRAYTSDGFRSSWDKSIDKAGIEGVVFHDLRGTFITYAYRHDVSIKHIAEISGHSEGQAETVIRKHYLAGEEAISILQGSGINKQKQRTASNINVKQDKASD